MATTKIATVDQYIRSFPPETQDVLASVREAIWKAVPKADEAISYQIAAFTLDGHAFLYMAGFKRHFSLYPATDELVGALPEVGTRVVSRGTIKFPLDERVPVGLIRKIAKFKAKEHRALEAEKQRAKAAKKAPAKKTAARR